MEYQLEERTRDLHELVESCQTKVCFITETFCSSSFIFKKIYQGLTIVSPNLYLASVSSSYSLFYVDTTMPTSRWLINKNGLFVILQFTDNDENFFKRSGFESISNLLLNIF